MLHNYVFELVKSLLKGNSSLQQKFAEHLIKGFALCKYY